jgi:AsmA protein
VRKGVAFNDDLDGRSPLLRVRGSGSADIGAHALDYLLRVTVVDTGKGQGGKDVESLAGVTIPVYLTGPFEAPDWRIDWAAAAQEALKSRAGEQLRKQLEPHTERLREERDKLREQLKGGLKGLLSR